MRASFFFAAGIGLALTAACSRPDPPAPSPPPLEVGVVQQQVAFNPVAQDIDNGTFRYHPASPAWVGWSGACNNVDNRLRYMDVKFNVSTIPACATVTSATLTFQYTGCNTCQNTGTMYLYRISQGWTESATAGGCSGVTTGSPSVSSGLALSTSTSVLGLGVGGLGSFGYTVTGDVQNWVNGTTNNGWLLYFGVGSSVNDCASLLPDGVTTNPNWCARVGGPGCGGNKKHVYTRNDLTPANWPVLNVTYFLDNTKCNDGLPCTDNQCTAGGCTNPANNSLVCTDGRSCTTDACSSGACVSTPVNAACNDGNFCTNEVCNPGSGSANGAGCVYTNNALACNDGIACTTGDVCAGGACNGTPNNGLCADPNVCTNDVCTVGVGCSNPNNAASCNDGFACTTGDICSGGACNGAPSNAQCNDGNACTTDTCSPLSPSANAAGCVIANNASSCSDGIACTTGDTCSGGVCAGAPSNALCNDSNDCTTDSCTAGVGCANVARPDGVSCTWDNNVCHKNTCSGGLCNTPNPGVSCRTGSCGGSPPTAILPAVCTAGGACPAVSNLVCPTGLCNATNTACQGACALDGDCPSGYFCSSATCTAQHGLGGNCTRNAMCSNNRCVDNFCCSATCGGGNPDDCQACNNTGACATLNGTTCQDGNACTAVDTCSAGTCVGGAAPNCDDANPCTVDACDAATGCTHTPGNANTQCRSSAGACDVVERCDGISPTCPPNGYRSGSFQCSAPSCAAGTETLAVKCTGTGPACPAAVQNDCDPYVCGATACLQTCTVDANCIAGDYCDSGTCVPKNPPGVACTLVTQCASGHCVDGVCCDGTCTGQCEACNLQGSLGNCRAVSGTPVAPRAACDGDGSICDGTCDGTLKTACTYATSTTRCRSPSCTAGVGTLAASCDGAGNCPAVKVENCAPFVCGPSRCLTTCAADAQCQPGMHCKAGGCVPLLDAAAACTEGAECKTGICADGLCCDSACGGQCEACDVAGSEGTCSAVGGDPHGTRTPCASDGTSCSGFCGGSRDACVYPGPGLECRAAECTSGTAIVAAYCQGTGACPPEQVVVCGTPCVGKLCDTDCNADDDCNLGSFCLAGRCTPQRTNGEVCGTPGECSSANCVDGVCCDGPCTGQCEACNVNGSEGTCSASVGAPRGVRPPCAGTDVACAGACDGSTRTQCTYPTTAVVCTPASCVSGVATLVQTCAGDGSCAPLQQQNCAPASCNNTTKRCGGGCALDSNCASTEFCSGGVCVTRLAPGTPCAASTQCASGYCVDHVCCDRACDEQCEACNDPSSVGRCVTVTGRPHGARAPCGGAATCAGSCNGADPSACAFPSQAVSCGEAVCVEGIVYEAPSCNGAGSCIAADTTDCYPFACGADGVSCGASCLADEDCAADLVCSGGTCTQPTGAPEAGVDGGPDAGTIPDAAAPGAGGAPATSGGAPATSGGAPGTGGGSVIGAGGTANAPDGGAGDRDGGTGIDAGKDAGAVPARSKDEGGCGCRVHSSSDNGASWLGLAALAWIAARRRSQKRLAA